LPLVGKQDFGWRSSATILAFVVAFGAAKALTNLAAGDLAERIGRKQLLEWIRRPTDEQHTSRLGTPPRLPDLLHRAQAG
jgi:hypothetical protein